MKKLVLFMIIATFLSLGCGPLNPINHSIGVRLGTKSYDDVDVSNLTLESATIIEPYYEMTILKTIDAGIGIGYVTNSDESASWVAPTVYGMYRMTLAGPLVLRIGLGADMENFTADDSSVDIDSATGLGARLGFQINLADSIKPEVGLVYGLSSTKVDDGSGAETVDVNPITIYAGCSFGF